MFLGPYEQIWGTIFNELQQLHFLRWQLAMQFLQSKDGCLWVKLIFSNWRQSLLAVVWEPTSRRWIVRLSMPTALPKLENKRHPLSNCRLRGKLGRDGLLDIPTRRRKWVLSNVYSFKVVGLILGLTKAEMARRWIQTTFKKLLFRFAAPVPVNIKSQHGHKATRIWIAEHIEARRFTTLRKKQYLPTSVPSNRLRDCTGMASQADQLSLTTTNIVLQPDREHGLFGCGYQNNAERICWPRCLGPVGCSSCGWFCSEWKPQFQR